MPTTAPGAHTRQITLGDYAGMLGRDALAQISAARLVASIEPTPVDEIDQAGFVLGQEPQPGAQLRRNQMVILYVADHPEAVLAPPREEKPAPKRRRSRPQDPSLFDESVSTDAQRPPDPPVSPSDLGGDTGGATATSPFPARPRRTWPGQPGHGAAPPSRPGAEVRQDPPSSPFPPRPRAVPAAEPGPGPDDDCGDDVAPQSYLDSEPDFADDEISDAEFEPDEPAHDPDAELLEPDQVSDTAVLEHYRPEPTQRPRRRRPQPRFRRLSGRQTIAALLSGVVTLYLAASLLGGAHDGSPTSATVRTRTVVRTVPAPPPTTTAQAPPARRPQRGAARPRPRPVHHRPVRHRASSTPTTAPSTPTQTPAAPSTTPSTPPATDPTPAPSSTGSGAATPERSHRAARSSSSSPLSPIGPIAPAPDQP